MHVRPRSLLNGAVTALLPLIIGTSHNGNGDLGWRWCVFWQNFRSRFRFFKPAAPGAASQGAGEAMLVPVPGASDSAFCS